MPPAASLRLPLLVALLVGLPVFWAFPDELPCLRGTAIVTGWIGCGLLLASLLLMVREPGLASWLGGLERMYLWHHRLGVVAYLVLLAHPLALAAASWGEGPALAWAILSPWQQSWPGWLGWASLLCLMGGTGAALARRLPYGAWRQLHWLLAAAIILGLAHLLLLGLTLSLVWAPLLAIAFIAWRLLRSDLGLAARPYIVSQVDHPADAMVEVTLRPLDSALPALPGQFVLAAFGSAQGFHGGGEYHPFTISGIGSDGRIALGIKALGDCTRNLQAVTTGVPVRLQGPFGTFLREDEAGPALWVAGGIGITPFLAALRQGPLTGPVCLIYLHRDTRDAAYSGELRALATHEPNLRWQEITCGEGLPDLAAALPAAEELAGHACYLCGPPGLIEAAGALLQQRGVAIRHIHFERFDFR